MSADRLAMELADLWPIIMLACIAVGVIAYRIGRASR